ncbi:acyltransferase [Porticoccus sp. W117]|uniref:acyltransferase family protein n=1 Tax=Porticoccus sp. W117 TaxID=3054777 RepID=UPI002592F2DF|nr:acyltransferase [Porticoccus sp. W117]MDM3870616.1 acyltransferase [Porticoccus sp. W117]
MRIEELTFFRFLAASIVVIFHFGKDLEGIPGFLRSGPEMVTFFFVLSGFVMGISYFNKPVVATKYLWARFSRITPVYFLALGLVLASMVLSHQSINPIALLLNVTFLQSWVSPFPLSLNGPGWSLSVEAFFYCAFPLILICIKQLSLTSKAVLGIGLGFWVAVHLATTYVLSSDGYEGYPSFSHDMIYYFPPTHLCSFILGIAGAIWIYEQKSTVNKNSWLTIAVVVVCFSIVVILNNKRPIEEYFGLSLAFGSSLLSPLFLLFIVLIAWCDSRLIALFRSYPLVLLGEASYAFYILQKPVHILYEKYMPREILTNEWISFSVFFLLLTGVSICVFYFFEKPMNNFLRHRVPAWFSKQKSVLTEAP